MRILGQERPSAWRRPAFAVSGLRHSYLHPFSSCQGALGVFFPSCSGRSGAEWKDQSPSRLLACSCPFPLVRGSWIRRRRKPAGARGGEDTTSLRSAGARGWRRGRDFIQNRRALRRFEPSENVRPACGIVGFWGYKGRAGVQGRAWRKVGGKRIIARASNASMRATEIGRHCGES